MCTFVIQHKFYSLTYDRFLETPKQTKGKGEKSCFLATAAPTLTPPCLIPTFPKCVHRCMCRYICDNFPDMNCVVLYFHTALLVHLAPSGIIPLPLF